MSFEELNLNPKLLKAIQASGFTEPTAIQGEAIPVVLSGRDLMASAQTGTGKTAAFVLPALQKLLTPASGRGIGPRVLVLTPTRELAMQVNDNIRQFSRFGKFVTGSVVGGMAYPAANADAAPAPGFIGGDTGALNGSHGAGAGGFLTSRDPGVGRGRPYVGHGFCRCRQNHCCGHTGESPDLLFSATLEGKVFTIAKQLLKDPARIQLAANHERHASIQQQVHQADDLQHKHSLLSHHLTNEDLTQAVIFTATKRNADKLAKSLSALGHASAALHGDMGQGARKRTVEHMRRGKYRLLVATDVAARGSGYQRYQPCHQFRPTHGGRRLYSSHRAYRARWRQGHGDFPSGPGRLGQA